MACSDPSQFRSLVAPHCTDLRSDKCAWALVQAGGAFGPGCLDLSIVASPELGMPPYRDYVCPRSTGALARLCGPPKQQVASDAGAGARTGSSYGTLAAGLGVSTAVLGLTTVGMGINRQKFDKPLMDHYDEMNKQLTDNIADIIKVVHDTHSESVGEIVRANIGLRLDLGGRADMQEYGELWKK